MGLVGIRRAGWDVEWGRAGVCEGMGWNGTGRDEMEWVGMEWIGTGWDGMGWAELGFKTCVVLVAAVCRLGTIFPLHK